MIFKTSIVIPWTISDVFDALNAPSMMRKVAAPLVIFKAVRPEVFPKRWENGSSYRMSMYFLGFLPLGWQELKIESTSNDAEKVLKDFGPGLAVKMWNHTVVLRKIGDAKTQYEETLVLSAGLMTPLIWMGMTALFAWRKYRWLSISKHAYEK